MTDVQQLNDSEIALYLRKAQAALEFSPDFAERHRLAHLITLLRLEIERRARTGGSRPSDAEQASEAIEDLRSVLGPDDDDKPR